MESLIRKAGRGVGWNMLAQVVQQAIRFIIIVILTRLLDPGDFGVFAMVFVFTELILPFREWGFQAALIQKENVDEEYQSTAFWAISGIAVVIYVLSCLSAPFISHFFNAPILGKIIPIISIVFLMSPLGSIQWVLLTKELNFRILAFIGTIATLFYGVTACFFALWGYGVWSLVLATLAMEISRSLMLWFVRGWRPLWRFSITKFREIMSFAFNCMGSGVLNYGINNFDNLMVGKCLGAVPLGFYNLAFNTVSQPQMRVVSQITNVIFPVYSIIKGDKERFNEAYLKTVRMVSIITVPLITILFVSAKDFVLVFYGHKWLPAVLPIKIMSLYGLVRALTSIASPVFLSQGRPDIDLRLTLLRLVVFSGLVFYGIRNGISGVALAVLSYSILNFFPTFYLSNRLLGIGQLKFFLLIFKYILFSIFIVTTLVLSHIFYQRLGLDNSLSRLILSIIIGILSSFIIFLIFSKEDLNYFVRLVKEIIF